MSNEALSAADQLDRLARIFEGIVEARDVLRKVGPLDEAIRERKAKIESLAKECDKSEARAKELKQAESAELQAAKGECQAAIEHARQARAQAEEDAAAIRAAAKAEADERLRKQSEALGVLEAKAKERLSQIESSAKVVEDATVSKIAALDAINAEIEASEAKLALIRNTIADLVKA